MSEESKILRGGVRGFSMWPNLIPGDILKAELMKISQIRPGMIAVLSDDTGKQKIVHRILSIGNSGNRKVVVSGGDRSGRDSEERYFNPELEIPIVSGVLRRGRYRKVGSLRIPEVFSPLFVMRNYCRIVRRLLW